MHPVCSGAVLALGIFLAGCSSSAPPSAPPAGASAAAMPSLDSLAIPVTAAQNREFSFTDKQSGYYYATTHSPFNEAWFAGWNLATKRVLKDYELRLDGRVLDRTTAQVTVLPQLVRRQFATATEELLLFDNQPILGIRVKTTAPHQLGLRVTGDLTTAGAAAPEGLWLTPKEAPTHHILLAPWQATPATYQNGVLSAPASSGGFVLVYGPTQAAVQERLQAFREQHTAWLAAREQRLSALVTQTNPLHTSDAQLNHALPWLMLTTDQLVTNQQGWGIYAGLPWFNDYWGRDLFISLPGACLVTGQFATARKILLSFARLQNTDPTSRNYGRVPNRARPDDIIYNTTDGTPRFVLAALDYVRYSGDTAVIRELYPAVRRAAEGSLKHWVDARGYLTHEDADTWMDAKEKGTRPFSPRGNRANDIQALWYQQLLASAQLADYLHDAASARQWRAVAAQVQAHFAKDFLDARHPYLADHLRPDGSPDFQLRPNQLYTFELLEEVARRQQITKTVWQELVYPWGVASLSQHDPNFHPYHENWHYYHKDAAYHNGTVWLWNNGMAMQRLLEFDQPELAYQLFRNMNHQALVEGAVGSLSENADALPRPGQARGKLSGTFLQAWSNAEQVRVWYQYFLGVRPNLLRNEVVVRPVLPSGLPAVSFGVRVGAGELRAQYTTGPAATYSVQVRDVAPTIRFSLPGLEEVAAPVPDGGTLRARAAGSSLRVEVLNSRGRVVWQARHQASPALQAQQEQQRAFFADARFATPYLAPNLPSLRTYHAQPLTY